MLLLVTVGLLSGLIPAHSLTAGRFVLSGGQGEWGVQDGAAHLMMGAGEDSPRVLLHTAQRASLQLVGGAAQDTTVLLQSLSAGGAQLGLAGPEGAVTLHHGASSSLKMERRTPDAGYLMLGLSSSGEAEWLGLPAARTEP